MEHAPGHHPHGSKGSAGDSDPTWANPISGYFTPKDVACMKNNSRIDLSSHTSVAANAQAIYGKVSTGAMPLGEPRWTTEKVSTFQSWMNAGCP